jgi:deoxyribodipyrimidine photo-lyase
VNLIHAWKLNMIEQQFYDCEIGKDYPVPLCIEETRRYASDIVWSFRKKDEVKEEGKEKSMFLIRIGKQEKQNFDYFF